MGPVLGHLRVTDLARRAGLSAGAFYHYWDDQDAYRDDVVAALLAAERPAAAPDLFGPTGAGGDDADGPTALDRAVRRAGARLADDPWHRLDLALWAHHDPALVDGLTAVLARTETAWGVALGRGLAAWGRAPDDGWDLDGLATAATALGDGLRTQHLVDPAVVDLAADRPWAPPALLALLLVLGATRPGTTVPTSAPHPAPTAADDHPGRRRLLDLGVAAVLTRPAGNALDHVRADDVVADLDLTIGAFFHHWPGQDDYRDDLVDVLFDADRYVDPDDRNRAQAPAPGEPVTGDLAEAVRASTTWYWSVAADHPDNRVQLGFLTFDDPYVTGCIAEQAASLRAVWHAAVAASLEEAGRHWRAPLDTDLVVLGLAAALDGYVVRQGLGRPGLGPDEHGWTAWGRTGLALIDAASAPAGDDRPLLEVAAAALRP